VSRQVQANYYKTVGEVFGYTPIAADMFIHAVHDQQAALSGIRRGRSQDLHAPPGIISLHLQVDWLPPERIRRRDCLLARAGAQQQAYCETKKGL
jgi:hypothetical protein